MTDSTLINISPEAVLSLFLKVLFVLGGLLYLIFAGLVIRQISLMSRTVETPTTGVIKILGYIHLILAALVFAFYLLVL